MISRQTIQKVNDLSDILDVVGAFVKLKKRGVNYLGNCPFHNEKTLPLQYHLPKEFINVLVVAKRAM